MMLLVSVVSGMGEGGVQMVNRLVLAAAEEARLPGVVVSLHDRPSADWVEHWPGSYCAQGSKPRFLWGALTRSTGVAGPVLVTHAGLVPVGRLARKRARTKLCLFLHGVEVWHPPTKVRAWGLAGVDRVVANSHYTLRRFREVHPGLAALPGDVCYLPARRLVDGPRAPRPSANGLQVLVVGRLWGRGAQKGQSQLIAVFPALRRRFPDATLCIVGDGERRQALEERARAPENQGAIRFMGKVSDGELADLYAASAVYAMPSEGEGFGLVFAEAMAHGLPCIASRYDAGAEVVAEGETGLLVDPKDSEDLLSALCRLLGDSALRARMGEAARKRASELFSLDRFNRRIVSLLRDGEIGR